MNKLIFICGTHGSGKSTLARKFINEHGGVFQLFQCKDGIVTVCHDGSAVLGDYKNPCGGIDGYKDWKQINSVLNELIQYQCPTIFFEGMITYGKDKYLSLSTIPGYEFCFIKLNTDIGQCIQNVLKRREERGNTKEFNPSNVFNKERSWYSMYITLLENGIENCYNLDFESALQCVRKFIGGTTE